MREELFYGIHVIHTFLEHSPERILEIFLTDVRSDERFEIIHKQAKEYGVSVTRVQKKDLDKWLPKTNHQGVAAKVRLKKTLEDSDLMALVEKIKTPLFLVLDSVQDPHNLGACLRTANAVGVDAVILPKDRATGLTPAVYKVSSGAAETVPVVYVTNLVRCLEKLKKEGVWIIGTSLDSPKTLYETDLRGPVAIVLGTEETGLRRLTQIHCDTLMQIPMVGGIESLNVSVAAGVCLYETLRQRNQ